MKIYATTDDVIKYRGPQDAKTLDMLDAHLEGCSARLRLFGKTQGVDVDELVENDEDVAIVVTERVVDSVMSKLNSNKGNEPLMSQFAQTAGGYSVSGTLVNIGGDYYFPKRFLRDIGILHQNVGTIEVFDYESVTRSNGNFT